jgi:hypothetical protein
MGQVACLNTLMTAKQFYEWQTSGGTDDVMRLIDCLERALMDYALAR